MAELWMPGAERRPQGQAVSLNRGLPARVTWHITADRLDANGVQPPFDNVSAYLERVAFCPTLMWDPVTGRVRQYYPADVGARALTRWNEDGYVNIQIEVYFAYGAVRDGVRYATVADTPCEGLEDILAWTDSWGVPRVWPSGPPQLSGNRQNVDTWNSQAGHFGHSQVPGETHSDPGPMPGFNTTKRTPLIPGVAGVNI